MGSRPKLALLAVLLCLGGAMTTKPATAASFQPVKGPDPAVAEWPEWPHRVVCGGLPFDPVAAFSSPTGVEGGSKPSEKALRRFLASGPLNWAHRNNWRLLVENRRIAEFAVGGVAGEMETMSFRRAEGRWKFSTYSSDCDPASIRREITAITWTLDPDHRQLTPTTRKIQVNLGPGPCSSGRSQNERLQKPEFREQGGALLMSLWLRPLPPGGYTCQGLIEPPVEITLPEPLGNRRLLDGGTYPPGTGREDVYGG